MVVADGVAVRFLCVLVAFAAGQAVADERFDPPTAEGPEALIRFMNALAEPGRGFTNRDAAEQYSRNAGAAIIAAADQLLAGEAQDEQAVRAIEMKAASLRLLGGLGRTGVEQEVAEWLATLADDARPAVAFAALRIQTTNRMRDWRMLRQGERRATLQQVAGKLSELPPTVDHARFLTFLADTLGESEEREMVIALVDELTPHLALADSPEMPAKLTALEAVARRLRLPGAPIRVEGTLLTGEPIDWERYRGKVVLIDYWATWCGLCHAELPNVRRMHEQYGDQGFEVLGVSLDEDKQRVEQFLTQQQIPWPTLFGHETASSGWNHPMVSNYGIHDLPRAILVDREGKVVHMNARGEQLAAQLERLFDAPEAADGSVRQVVSHRE